MKNKKLISMIAAVALVAVVGIGATLAYFTDKDDASNIVTMGHVDIDLKEPNFSGGADGGEIKNVTPGQEISKDPTVKVENGSEKAYIRLKLEVTGLDDAHKAQLLAKNTNGTYKYLDIDMDKWTESNEYFYYTGNKGTGQLDGVLVAGESVTLFEHVTIPGDEWKNEVVDTAFNIVITAEAIQADNFTPKTVNGVYGWFTSDNQGITAENYR